MQKIKRSEHGEGFLCIYINEGYYYVMIDILTKESPNNCKRIILGEIK